MGENQESYTENRFGRRLGAERLARACQISHLLPQGTFHKLKRRLHEVLALNDVRLSFATFRDLPAEP